MKVSLIVPVYNAEKYLRRCVDSVLNQEYMDFELLLVDDGSKDASGDICDEYAKKDERVRVIHKENSGVSDSRNLAISAARGEYLQFLDSDDWITGDATRLLVKEAAEHQCDLVIADFYRVVGERLAPKGDIDEDGVLTRDEYAAHMMENPADFYYGVLWNKLYRRDIVEKHGLRMDSAISWCEDFMFNLEYIRYVERVYVLRAPIYYYVKTKGSLVSQGNSIVQAIRMKLMVFEVYHDFFKHVLDEQEYEKKRLQVYRFLVDAAGDGVVPPAPLLGVRKLGEERSSVHPETLSGSGFLMEAYRERKLLEHYLEVAALKYDLPLDTAWLLFCLMENLKGTEEGVLFSRKELSDITQLTKGRLSLAVQTAAAKGLIRVDEPGKGELSKADRRRRLLRFSFLPKAEELLSELADVREEYECARLRCLSESEKKLYCSMERRIQENVRSSSAVRLI